MIIPIILAGGSGTRLWPLSREKYPKQFIKLIGEHSLLQETVLRVSGFLKMERSIIICNEQHYFICLDQLADIQIKDANYIIEPVGKNTAPAIAAAAFHCQQHYGNEAILLIMPSDHLIKDTRAFADAIHLAENAAKDDCLVTFGIQAKTPETGYGYIHRGKKLNDGIFTIEKFVEKPSLDKAQQFVDSGDYYWNGGLFMFKSSAYLQELQKNAPDIYQAVQETIKHSETQNNLLHLDKDYFTQCRDESIDYAVMETTKNGIVVELNTDWSDLGSWNAVSDAHEADSNNNVLIGEVFTQDTHNCYIRTENRTISTLGVDNLIVIDTPDSTLIAHKDNTQDIKKIVNSLKQIGHVSTINHSNELTPWGGLSMVYSDDQFEIKLIQINPGQEMEIVASDSKAILLLNGNGSKQLLCNEELLNKKYIELAMHSNYVIKNIASHSVKLLKINIQG